jgi:hypothetical protein
MKFPLKSISTWEPKIRLVGESRRHTQVMQIIRQKEEEKHTHTQHTQTLVGEKVLDWPKKLEKNKRTRES